MLISLPQIPSAASSYDVPEVHLHRVSATYPGEFVTIINPGTCAIDIEGLSITDGEGSIRFDTARSLVPGKPLSICENITRFHVLYPDEMCLPFDDPSLVRDGTFKLADKGDQVFIVRGSEVCDVMVYGEVEKPSDWEGPPLPKASKGDVFLRTGETSGYHSYRVGTAGAWSFEGEMSEATVSSLIYPLNALYGICSAIDRSRTSISLCTYLLENMTVVKHIAKAAERGVHATILLEGSPVGGLSSVATAAAYHLKESGCDVRLMKSFNGFRRYDYLHSKYLVIDDKISLISSENFCDSNFRSNRGWGTMIESSAIATQMSGIFSKDANGLDLDIFVLEDVVPKPQFDRPIDDWEPDIMDIESYRGQVRIVTSPDNILAETIRLVDSASSSILVQQMSVQKEWLQNGRLIDSIREAAGKGVLVRMSLNGGFAHQDDDNIVVMDALNKEAIENGWDLECRSFEVLDTPTLHNKGSIIDDQIIISSANWVDNSMHNNREVAAIISCMRLSEDMAALFYTDFLREEDMIIELPWDTITIKEGEFLDIDISPFVPFSVKDDVRWDIGSDGSIEWKGSEIHYLLISGRYDIEISVDCPFRTLRAVLTINVEKDDQISGLLIFSPLMVIPALVAFKMRRRV